MDYAQMNQAFAFALLGEDMILQAGYTNEDVCPILLYLWRAFSG